MTERRLPSMVTLAIWSASVAPTRSRAADETLDNGVEVFSTSKPALDGVRGRPIPSSTCRRRGYELGARREAVMNHAMVVVVCGRGRVPEVILLVEGSREPAPRGEGILGRSARLRVGQHSGGGHAAKHQAPAVSVRR